MGPMVAKEVVAGLLQLLNRERVEKYFFWNLISQNPDDSKLIDCAIAGHAAFMVTEDKPFRVLADIPFPRVEVMDVETFQARLRS